MMSRQTIELKEKEAYGWAMYTAALQEGKTTTASYWQDYAATCAQLIEESVKLDNSAVAIDTKVSSASDGLGVWPVFPPPKIAKPNFFSCDRQTAIDAVWTIGDHFCCYGGDTWLERKCDCKYGGPSESSFFGRSEQTGCPEMRTIHFVISNMTDEQWNLITSPSVVKK